MSEELEPKKPKRTRKPSAKSIDSAMDKYLAPQQKAALPPKQKKPRKPRSPVQDIINRRKAASVKPRLSETITFGALIDEKMARRYVGFLYSLKLTHPQMPFKIMTYIGKKGFESGSDWHYYQSSSEKVMAYLNAGWIISFDVLGYEDTEYRLKSTEATLIVKQWMNSATRLLNLNLAVVLGGVKWTRYRYCKRYLGVIDKSY